MDDDRMPDHQLGVGGQVLGSIGLPGPPDGHLLADPSIDLVVDRQVGVQQLGQATEQNIVDPSEVLHVEKQIGEVQTPS
jgi:hypothetical protein